MRILIIKLNKIGDVLLCTPLFANLKAHFPNCQIHTLVNKGTEGFLDTKMVDKIHLLRREKQFFKKIKAELSLLYAIFSEKYDIVLSLGSGERSAFLSLISGAKIRVGFPPKSLWARKIYTHLAPYGNRHNIEHNLDTLRLLKIPIISKKVVAKRAESCQKFKDLPERFIHCHFFSDWLFKCLEDSFCAEIVDFISENYGITCVLTAAPSANELQKLQNIKLLIKSRAIYFEGNLNLDEVALLNSKAVAFIGVDTSIMHLSGANDTPAFAFFGPTYASVWGIWDNELEGAEYHDKGGVQRFGKYCIYQESMQCIPCGKAGCDDKGISECLLNKLNKQNALNALKNFLDGILA